MTSIISTKLHFDGQKIDLIQQKSPYKQNINKNKSIYKMKNNILKKVGNKKRNVFD